MYGHMDVKFDWYESGKRLVWFRHHRKSAFFFSRLKVMLIAVFCLHLLKVLYCSSFESFIALKIYKMCAIINFKIVPVTNFNKYLHYGTRRAE